MNGNNRGLIITVIVIIVLVLGGILIYANYMGQDTNGYATSTDSMSYDQNQNSQTEGMENNNTTASSTTEINTNVGGAVSY